MLCGVVHRLPWVLDGGRPRNWWRLFGSVSACQFCHQLQLQALSTRCRTTEGSPWHCPCTASTGVFFFLLSAPSSPYSSWRGMWWSSILMLSHPSQLGLNEYGLDSGFQVGNLKFSCGSAPAVWLSCSTVHKSRLNTGEKSRYQLCKQSAS